MTSNRRSRSVRWLPLVLVVALAVSVSAAETVTFVPWPYGLIAYVDIEPPQYTLQDDIDRLVAAVASVCEFWGVAVPEPNEGWASALDPKRPQCMPWVSATRDVLPPGEDGPQSWSWCRLPWETGVLEELIVALYRDREALGTAVERFDISAAFNRNGIYSDDLVRKMPGPVIVMTESDFREDTNVLVHEMTHWLFDEPMNPIPIPGSNLRIMHEGAANLTAHAENEVYDPWRYAAQFAEDGDLRSVPIQLLYPIGETVVEVMIEQGIDLPTTTVTLAPGKSWETWASTKCGQSSQCEDWTHIVELVEPAWLERVALVDELSIGDRVRYQARLQRLGQVEVLLDPVLPRSASAVLDRIWTGNGVENSIDIFWKFALDSEEMGIEAPDASTWAAFARREKTLSHIAVRNAVYAAPPAPESAATAELEYPDYDLAYMKVAYLIGLRELELWDAYLEEYVSLVREYVVESKVDPDLIPWWNPEAAGDSADPEEQP